MGTQLNSIKFMEHISFASVLRVLFSDLFSKIILLFCVFIGFIIIFESSQIRFGDQNQYLAIANSILRFQEFSSWCDNSGCVPETHRTPGYPIFLSFFSFFGIGLVGIKLFQAFLYFLTILLVYGIALRTKLDVIGARTAIAILSLNIQIPYYFGQIAPDGICIFLIALYAFIFSKNSTKISSILLISFILAALFYMRPAILMLPVALIILSVLKISKINIRSQVLSFLGLLTFILPFALWNLDNHNSFKFTTIEGAGGVAHLGYWGHKLPVDYINTNYWGNRVIRDLTSPFQLFDEQSNKYLGLYENTWAKFNEAFPLDEYCYEMDNSILVPQSVFYNCTTQYIQEREKFLMSDLYSQIINNPLEYFLQRVYTFNRLFFSGISNTNSSSILQYIKSLIPFLITFSFIYLTFLFMTYKVLFSNQRKDTPEVFQFMWAVILYFAVSHSFFSIQARYLVPIHSLLIIYLAYLFTNFYNNSLYKIFHKKK
jgi:hypothetical protein